MWARSRGKTPGIFHHVSEVKGENPWYLSSCVQGQGGKPLVSFIMWARSRGKTPGIFYHVSEVKGREDMQVVRGNRHAHKHWAFSWLNMCNKMSLCSTYFPIMSCSHGKKNTKLPPSVCVQGSLKIRPPHRHSTHTPLSIGRGKEGGKIFATVTRDLTFSVLACSSSCNK